MFSETLVPRGKFYCTFTDILKHYVLQMAVANLVKLMLWRTALENNVITKKENKKQSLSASVDQWCPSNKKIESCWKHGSSSISSIKTF